MQRRLVGRKLLPLSFLFLFIILFSCRKKDATDVVTPLPPVGKDVISNAIAQKWADMTLHIIRYARFKSPTYSSRSLGYIGVTMYECVVNADPAHRSLLGQLHNLNYLPIADTNSEYDWQLALNSGAKTILKLLYPVNKNLTLQLDGLIDSAYQSHVPLYSSNVDAAVLDRSVQFGRQIAEAIFEWSKVDGGHEGFLRPFDTSFAFPSGPSYWVPPTRGQTVSRFPLHPHWGQNRTFVSENSTMPTPQIEPYSEDPSSDFYQMYNSIYEMSKNLTRSDKEIAAWWADDPTETYSPPGHSFNLGTIAIRTSNPGLVKAAETYARIGMATADAFICCWKTKFTYFNERPSTYVKRLIDSTWSPFWPEPPFPAFPSGHSTQSSATATVLSSLYGNDFSFIDDTHEGDVRFPFSEPMMPRSYSSFEESAVETGHSRLLGGIHTQQDNETGLTEGEKIGTNVNNLQWRIE